MFAVILQYNAYIYFKHNIKYLTAMSQYVKVTFKYLYHDYNNTNSDLPVRAILFLKRQSRTVL